MSGKKMLYLARHVKSDWSGVDCPDYDRGLNMRGKRDLVEFVPRISKKIATVDLVVSSGAKRTRKTARARAKNLGYDTKNIVYTDELYECDTENIIAIVKKIPQEVSSLMIVGHNPSLNNFVAWGRAEIGNVPTGGVVCFEYLASDRSRLAHGLLEFEWFEFPKKYK